MAITKEQLDRIRYFEQKRIPKYPYWYGNKKALYDYVGLPNWLPISVHLQHGAATIFREGKPDSTIRHSRYPVIFLSNERQKAVCDQYLKRPCYVIGSVFSLYRRHHNIIQSDEAKGTIAFPIHSTKDVHAGANWQRYAAALKALPERFQPVTVSIYFLDLLKGVHHYFEEEGLDVVTSGHIADEDFVKNFYDILRQFKFATGNEIGSNLYYAVEMGIPFFTYGDQVTFTNFGGNKDAPKATFKVDDKAGYGQHDYVRRLFIFDKLEEVRITEEQQTFVIESTGAEIAIPKSKMRWLILASLIPSVLLETLIFPLRLLRRMIK